MTNADVDELSRMLGDLREMSGVSPDTIIEIEGFLAEAGEDRLDPDDLAYARALHGRLAGRPADAAGEPAGMEPDDPDSEDDPTAHWRAIAEAAELRADEAERSLEEALEAGDDEKFAEIRRRFVERYGPDGDSAAIPDPEVRAAILTEFLAEFDEVEKLDEPDA